MNAAAAIDTDSAALHRAVNALETIILGKPTQVRLCLACLLARGHLLIEDVPGVGKTTLAHALAHVLGLAWQRVQFTSDLLPADIIGVSIFDRASQQFHFRQGPIFTQLLLADEVNRASPRTQSALLEAMEERQISADVDHLSAARAVLRGRDPESPRAARHVRPAGIATRPLSHARHAGLSGFGARARVASQWRAARDAAGDRCCPDTRGRDPDPGHVRSVYVSDAVLDYAQALIARTRERMDLKLGLSPRAGQGLIRAAQAWAYIARRAAVLPEDIQAVLPAVVSHRLERREPTASDDGNALANELIKAVPVPV